MVLIFYCEGCNNVIRLKINPFADYFTRLHNIKRPWVAISNELNKHDWTFDDEGRAYCPTHSQKTVEKMKTRTNMKHSKEFLEAQQMISSGGRFNVKMDPRDMERFKIAVFFVDQNIQETVSFLLKQFTDYVLSGNIREKSENTYQVFIEEMERKKREHEQEHEQLIKVIIERYFNKDIPFEQARKMAVNLLSSNDWNVDQVLGLAKINNKH
jgi:hypothetical protein